GYLLPPLDPSAMALDPYSDFLTRLGPEIPVERDTPLAPLTTFRIGGPADLLVRARGPEALAQAVLAAREMETPHVVLGRGANILVGDGGFRGVVIRSEPPPRGAVEGIRFLDDVTVRAAAGVETFPDLIMATVGRGLGGLHHYVGIPSTVGGALWQNLHFLSPDRDRTCFIEEVLAGAEILTAEGHRKRVGVEYFRFGYDDSILHHRPDLVLTADFRLEPAPVDELRRVIRENLAWRDDRHPDLWLYPSAGSVFQKIQGIGAGRLIDEVGLKGRVLGGAGIFQKHANIIVNLGGATAAEVRALMELCRETVLRELGYELVPEIGLVGEF
ncbi:MAG TPA: UDP-N-acetylmuramate dehydrogenase, partial [Longimicrobiales bacterium]|nr:UDP-N-acetylmuramate dehydrogenase [Longimicrobiales bacterium]